MKKPLLQLMKSSLKIHSLFPCPRIWLVGFAAAGLCLSLRAAPFDAAPFGLPPQFRPGN